MKKADTYKTYFMKNGKLLTRKLHQIYKILTIKTYQQALIKACWYVFGLVLISYGYNTVFVLLYFGVI